MSVKLDTLCGLYVYMCSLTQVYQLFFLSVEHSMQDIC